MSETAKKRTAPKGYSPRKPEILAMAARQGERADTGKKVLRGIAPLRYGNPSAVCFIGSAMRLMEALGDPVDQDELFALSGAGLCFPWRQASNCDEISIISEIPRRTFAALGYQSDLLYEAELTTPRRYSKELYLERIKRSIDGGRPVIGFGCTHENYACLITGYDSAGLYLRAFWAPGGAPDGYDTAGEYYHTGRWYETCYGILTVGHKSGVRLSGADAYRHIRQSAALMNALGSVETQGQMVAAGFAAYDAMAAWLLDDGAWTNLTHHEVFLKQCGILLLEHYRHQLLGYLARLSREHPGVVDPGVLEAIGQLCGLVKGAAHSDLYLHESVDPSLKDFFIMKERAAREKVAAFVRRLQGCDREVFRRLTKAEGE